jgi:DegV family protein with EDD domain
MQFVADSGAMVKIVTESTADIPGAMAARLGITIVPSYVMFGTETYRDGVDLSREQFYAKLAESNVIPTTATPPPGFYEEVYRRLASETDEIVSIHLAARLSALYGVASTAAASVSGVRIAVVDSEQVTMGYGWLAVAAAEAAQRGETLEQIVALVEDMKGRSWVLAALDTLEYLHRGGRVNWVQATVGTLLQIKPIIEIRAGQVNLVERVRTHNRAIRQLIELVKGLGPLERAIVLHADGRDAAERVADLLQEIHPDWERLIDQAGVTIASHAGPGAVGIACITAQ